MAEVRATVRAMRAGPLLARSAEIVLTQADGGRVVSSTRLVAPVPLRGPARDADELAVRRLMSFVDVLASVPGAAIQSGYATATAWYADGATTGLRRGHVVARLETPGGPVVTGTGNDDDPAIDAGFPERLDPPPVGWRARSLVLRPPVAAVLVSAARLVLTARAMRSRYADLSGRRILPGLTIVDSPAAHRVGAPGDNGRPAVPHPLVDRGRLRPVEFDSTLDLMSGRAVWDHDTQALGPAPVTRLDLSGPECATPDPAVELAWCVEGLQRYHRDGILRLRCLARTAGAGWFVVELRGRPLHVLQATVGVSPPYRTVYSDDEVRTPSIVLCSAERLEEQHGAVLTGL